MGNVLFANSGTEIHERGESRRLPLLLLTGCKWVKMLNSQVLGFKLSHAGILASLPYLARFISGFIFGSIGDAARKNGWMSVTAIRKFFCIFCEYNETIK